MSHFLMTAFVALDVKVTNSIAARLLYSGTQLVTIMRGANDLLLLGEECNDDLTGIENRAPQFDLSAIVKQSSRF